jgi:hypothetical protein
MQHRSGRVQPFSGSAPGSDSAGPPAAVAPPGVTRGRLSGTLQACRPQQVGHVWKKIGVLNRCQAEAGFVPRGWSAFNIVAHRMTGWETMRAANGVSGDKGEMPAPFGACQQVGRSSCSHTQRIPFRGIKSLRALVAIRVALPPGVGALSCRTEQAVGKTVANEDHRNSALKSLNNKIQYLDS